MKHVKFIFLLITVYSLAACGGGGTQVSPAAPRNVSAEATAGLIRISWEHAGSSVSEFVIYRKTTLPDAVFAEIGRQTDEAARQFDDRESLDLEQQYVYGVAASGPGGESTIVAAEQAVQPSPAAGTVRVRVLFGGGGKGSISSADNRIDCSEPGGAKCSADYPEGETVVLSASANLGSAFTGWEGGGCSGTAPCTLNVGTGNEADANTLEITARFNQTGYVLTVEKAGSGNGRLVSTPAGIDCGSDCSEVYLIPVASNPAIMVGFSSVAPDDGALFNGWGGACPTPTSTSGCVVTMDDDKNVTAYFSAPAADSYSVNEGETLTVDAPGVLSNDVALAGGVILNTTPIDDPDHGTLALGEDGSFTYVHDGSEAASDSFVYEVSDARGNSESVTVNLTIATSNDAPVAQNDIYATAEDTTLTVNAANGVLSNDSDDEGDALTAERVDGPDHGTLTLNANGAFSYTPDTNYSGSDSFSYVATAAGQSSSPATVTITVDNDNDPPVAVNGSVSLLEDTLATVTLVATDADSPGLTFTIVSGPSKGSLILDAGPKFVYTPNANANGSDSFTFRASDGNSSSNTATVTISITPVNDAPNFTLASNPPNIGEDAGAQTVPGFATNISKGAANESGQVLSFQVTRTDEDGELEFAPNPAISANGTLTYTPQTGSSGTATFAAVLADNGGTANGGDDTSVTRNFTITVEAAPPVQYALTVNKTGTGTGTVTGPNINCGSDCSASYDEGSTITLSATAASGSTFAGWSGACTNTTGDCIVTMTTARTVTARFDVLPPDTFNLTLTIDGSGTGAVNFTPPNTSCSDDCVKGYEEGTAVTLTATPTSGSSFAGWSGAGCSGTGTCIVTMNAAKSVSATFELIPPTQYTLNVTSSGSGSGTVTSSPSGINCGSGGSDCTEDYDEDTVVTLTAAATGGSSFAGWSGACTNTVGTCTLTMDSDKTVTANFAPPPPTEYQLSVSLGGDGSGTVTSSPAGIDCEPDCAVSYVDGTAVTLSAAATSGSSFAGWSGAGCSGTGTCIVTMSAARSVTAAFSLNNTAPTAEAGSYSDGVVGDTVYLDGSASADDDGTIVSYVWTLTSQPGGSSAALTDATTATPYFTPDVAGNYTVQLTVTDDDGATSIDAATIGVGSANVAPTADAGSDLSAEVGEPVSLDGSASTDDDGTVISYSWSFADNPGDDALDDATSATPSFTPTVADTYTLQLTVTDDDGESSSPDFVDVIVDALPTVTSLDITPDFPSTDSGDEVTLEVSVETSGSADETVSWASSDETVATVDSDGVVSGLTPGEADITATSTFDSSISDTVTLTVNGIASVEITALPTEPLALGASFPLSVAVVAFGTADAAVSWNSSDPGVATVSSDGVVTAQTVGSTTVSVTSDDDPSKTDEVSILVSGADEDT